MSIARPRRTFLLVAALVSAAAAMPAGCTRLDGAGPPDEPVKLREDMRRLITTAKDRVYPALVNIRVITVTYWGGKESKGGGTGSGTIISKEGHVVTNFHVVDNGKKFKVTLSDKQEVSADLVGEDPQTDLAVLKINLKELKDPANIPVAQVGDSLQVQVGDTVLAMGSPYSLSRSVTLGIVSNAERVFTGFGGGDVEEDSIDGNATGAFTRWIQHDALINPGNSGGPLVNLQGEVIGVNARGGSGMGFAIPSSMARDVADKLVRLGEVPRSAIGVAFKHIEKTGLSEGVLIQSVDDNPPGPAAKAGIKAGDLMVKMNGKPTTVKFAEEVPALTRVIADMTIGSTIEIDYLRDGKPGHARVVTEKMLKDKGDETALRGWGISVMSITEQMARSRRLETRDGVYISGIRQGGPAALAEPAIGHGDIIKSIGGKPVKNLAEIVERYKVIMSSENIPEFLLVEFDRRGKDQVTVIKPKPDKREDPPREVPKAWVGVDVQPVLRDLAKQMGVEQYQGFRITRVFPRTMAAQSDLKVGDIILSVNGAKVTPRGMQDAGLFGRKIRELKVDEQATLNVLRGDKTVDVKVSLERTKIGPGEARRDENKDFEITVREITFFDRDDNRWADSVSGVVVEGVEHAGWCGLGGVGPYDLIQRIDQYTITDLESYRKAMEAITKAQPERVTFVVLRGTRTQYNFVEPEWKPVLDKKAVESGAKAPAKDPKDTPK